MDYCCCNSSYYCRCWYFSYIKDYCKYYYTDFKALQHLHNYNRSCSYCCRYIVGINLGCIGQQSIVIKVVLAVETGTLC